MPLVLLAVLVLIAIAAPRYGVDSRWSRPGEAPAQRGPTLRGDLTRLAAAVRRLWETRVVGQAGSLGTRRRTRLSQ
ncbi:hypothetical protein SAMN05443637_116108 [Pseudonocardia thermophila]|jgi:hypothetical protein|uniref:Uncharacterized protein n=2 Tax=Pseudonocardia thermophila TaxID=1848 RepID=A0A1M6X903_PSETH|nr:hypothetical protein [Pseudonocardia thermophila]SHL02457.1 hypothetical protein SAMN05443637_116108 [Pseudonocardia thermophila]